MSSKECGADDFAFALGAILNGVEQRVVDHVLPDALKAGSKVAAKEWRKGAKSLFRTNRHSRINYRKSIKTDLKLLGRGQLEVVVHSGKPGLPHLLEHGHATPARTKHVAGRTHIKAAAENGKKEVMKVIKQHLDRGLMD
ncbi:hypothetical protein [Atopobium fossor]|uniref:hypothetical protein n=1 Tax=Atopobium fossor TaxID=39487 RepID=UPI00054CF7B3|nr:hypothetical protein [Atopobium fossor]